jgi:hypothetical protein
MRVILIGGGETIETIYFLGRLFASRGYRVTIVNPHQAEAEMLSRRVRVTVIVGDGSDPYRARSRPRRQKTLRRPGDC